jgi:hypothetical protein
MAKYIKTKDGEMIVFSESILHSTFMHRSPISAGFIKFYTNKDGELDCHCYGESISLGLASEPEDSGIAKAHLLRLI